MAADPYAPSCFQTRADGNAAVPSGKALDIEAGGALTFGGSQANVTTATATATGATTGTIADTGGQDQHVTVTSDDANKIVILPTPVVGKRVWLHVGATGFELRSNSPTTVAINGGTGAAAESAIPANSTLLMVCVSATAWKGIFLDADGDVAKVEAAA